MNFLGLDIGTSAVKGVLVDLEENIIAGASQPLVTARPQPLWSEQNPQDWWEAVGRVVAQLRRSAPEQWRNIRAIGLSGQMHGTVLLDKNGCIIRPAILWNDGRAAREARMLAADIPDIGRVAGVEPMAGLTAPKLLWLRQKEPDNFERITRVLLPKDFIRWRMNEAFATDMCDASGTLWLDVGRRQWLEMLVRASGLTLSALPVLLEGSENSGPLRADIARDWGLSSDVIVAAGAGDAAAGAVGIGAISEGDAFISLGTSAQYFIARDRYRPAPEKLIHAFCHALSGRWFQMAALLNGASCLVWAAGLFDASDIGELIGEAETAFAGPSHLIFLPYLSGERTPYNNPHAKGVFYGLTPGSSRADIILAILEGIALSLADCQQHLENAGARVEELGVTGGGARSHFWMRLLAAILNRPLKLYAGSETGPAFGAARLARLAVTGELPHTACRPPVIREQILPDPCLVEAYAGRLKRFRAFYRALVPNLV